MEIFSGDGSHTYTWDAEAHPLTADSVNLTYDALGRMVEQNRSGSFTEIVYSPSGGKLALMNGASLQKAIIPLPSGGVAVYSSSGLLYYGHSDHLGSARLGSTPSRTTYFDLAYAPFGETYATSGAVDPAFTGQRQDTSSGLFDFPVREYSIQGRWSSPDPAGFDAVSPSNPQTWNRYAYVINAPLAAVDPLGMYLVCREGILYDEVDFFVDGTYQGSDFDFLGTGCGQNRIAPVARGGGRGGGRSFVQTIKNAACELLPSGGVTSVEGTMGTVGGVTGSFNIVTNYDSGQVTAFRSGGGFVGLQGEWSGGISSGAIFGGLASDNSNFGGYFTSANAGYSYYGLSVSASSGGYKHPLTLSTPIVVSASVGRSLFLPGSFTVSETNSIPVAQLGSFADGTAPTGSSYINYNRLLYLLRRPCN